MKKSNLLIRYLKYLFNQNEGSYCSFTAEATAHLLCLCLIFILRCASPAESTGESGTVVFQTCLLCITVSTSTDAFKNSQEVQMSKMLRKGKKSEGRHTVRSNEICYSGPFYTHLITRSNRFCETPSPFEDTPTTHVIWLVFYMRYQPRPIMRADHNVPVIRLGGGGG